MEHDCFDYGVTVNTDQLIAALQAAGFTVTDSNRSSIRRTFRRCEHPSQALMLALGAIQKAANTGRMLAIWTNELEARRLL